MCTKPHVALSINAKRCQICKSLDALNENQTLQSSTAFQTCPDAAAEAVPMVTIQADSFHPSIISVHFHPL